MSELNDNKEGWKNARTFGDILYLYLEFLKGEYSTTATYDGKLNDDTIKDLETIRKLNEMYFLTLDSQDGLINSTYNIFIKQYEKVIDKYTLKQRAYVDGYIHKNFIEVVTDYFDKSEDIIIIMGDISDDGKTSQLRSRRIPVTLEYVGYDDDQGEVFTRVGITNHYKEQITEWIQKYNTNKLNLSSIFEDVIPITFIDMKWGRQGYLTDMIYKALKSQFK